MLYIHNIEIIDILVVLLVRISNFLLLFSAFPIKECARFLKKSNEHKFALYEKKYQFRTKDL